MYKTPRGGSSADKPGVLSGEEAYFNGRSHLSQFHYDSRKLHIGTDGTMADHGGFQPSDALILLPLLAPFCLILLIMPEEQRNCL